MTPAAMRAMRGALDWSMRDTASASGLGLGTVLRAEQGEAMTRATLRRLRDAFRVRGVTCRIARGLVRVTIGAPPSVVKADISADLLGLPYVAVRKRASGTHRVAFEVPARLRPEGWPSSRPLPIGNRSGVLDEA
jgi:transcriptional regulator with XRE-family HTH domain